MFEQYTEAEKERISNTLKMLELEYTSPDLVDHPRLYEICEKEEIRYMVRDVSLILSKMDEWEKSYYE